MNTGNREWLTVQGPNAPRWPIAFVLVMLATAPVSAANPAIRLDAKSKPQGFEITGLDAADLDKLKQAKLDEAGWQALFTVHTSDNKDLPAMAGSYLITATAIRFEPQFPLVPGVRFRVTFHEDKLPGRTIKNTLRADFELPRPPLGPPAVVTHVYPSADTLPENQLKFYVHFSAPMARGDAYKHVRLLDENGKQVEVPFLELGEELWGADCRRFTLYFDPGRIKRGLKPREEDGPCLVEGKNYTFVVERTWLGADGQPLKESFRKKIKVLAPDDTPPDPKNWKIVAPPAGAVQPIEIKLPEPLDNALLHRCLWLVDAKGNRIAGKIEVSGGETVWRLTPAAAWQPGRYELVVDTTLEDRAGNTIGRPFELDIFNKIDRETVPATVKVPFEIR